MGDSTIKPDSGNDLVLQNNGGTGKIEVNDGGEITVTLGGSAGDDLNIDSNTLVVESDTNSVGFGTNDPAQQVHISGATPIIQLTDTDTGADSLITASNATGSLKIQCDNNNETGSSTFEVDVDGSQRMKVDSTGDLTITDGDLVIGTGGHGISFENHSVTSATGASSTTSHNVLDDYEEGIWTPAMTSGSKNINFTSVSATYTKIGRIVHVNMSAHNVTSSETAGSGASVNVSGLPFSNVSGTRACGTVIHGWGLRFDKIPNATIIPDGNSYVYCSHQADDSNYDNVTVTNVGSGNYFGFSITYRTS